jgi:hypothetical protein
MFNHYASDGDSVNAMVRAGGQLRNEYMERGPKPDGKNLIVWMSPPGNGGVLTTDLGADGLGLVALTEIEKVQPKVVSFDDLKALARFILSLQKEDGSFHHRYRDQKGPVMNWDCLYYPGEAVCGLLSLYEVDHSQEWLTVSGKALAYLAKSRTTVQKLPDDHWALIATAKFLPHYEQSQCSATQAELMQHAVQICQAMLTEQITNATNPDFNGGFTADGRTTPAATRLEGLLAALEFLPPSEIALRKRIETSVNRGIDFLLGAQIKSGEFAGGMPAIMPETALQNGSTAAQMEIRIDYVQHALCAMIRYQTLFPAEKKLN